jgi:hypothetical protein
MVMSLKSKIAEIIALSDPYTCADEPCEGRGISCEECCKEVADRILALIVESVPKEIKIDVMGIVTPPDTLTMINGYNQYRTTLLNLLTEGER